MHYTIDTISIQQIQFEYETESHHHTLGTGLYE